MGTYTAPTSTLVDMLMDYKHDHGLSDRDLAEKLNVSHGSPSNWRRGGKIDVDLDFIQRAARLLDIEDWQVPLLYYGVEGPGPEMATVGPSPRSANREIDTTSNVLQLFGPGRDPAPADDRRWTPTVLPYEGEAA